MKHNLIKHERSLKNDYNEIYGLTAAFLFDISSGQATYTNHFSIHLTLCSLLL